MSGPHEWLLQGPRTRLRAPQLDDADLLAAFRKDNRTRFASLQAEPPDFYAADWWRRHVSMLDEAARAGQLLYLVVFAASQPSRVAGVVSFVNIRYAPFYTSDLGFAVDGQHEGTGLMREAVELAIEHVFERRGLHRLAAEYAVSNVRSAALLERLGFRQEGLRRSYLRIADGWEDFVTTALINDRWDETATGS